MTTVTVLLLVGLWAAVLVPGAWRDRRNSPRQTVDGFRAAMQRLATCDHRRVLVYGGPGREVHPARSARSAREDLFERRRAMLGRLLGLVAATVVTALVVGGWLWWSLAAIAVLSCTAYVGALRWRKLQRDRTRAVVLLHPAQRARDAARPMMEQAAQPSAERSRSGDARRDARVV